MTNLTDMTAGIKAWFDAKTLPNITKKIYQPALEEITSIPMGVLIVTWDRANFSSLALPYNDQVGLLVQLDCMVKPGKALETVDAIRQALTEENHMGRAVVTSEIEEVEFYNPSQGKEPFTMTLRLNK